MTVVEKYFELNPVNTDPQRIRKERDRARKLKKSQWWLNLVNQGTCAYCKKTFSKNELTMDHYVPLARGGLSTKSNIVPSCCACNQEKKLEIPTEEVMRRVIVDSHHQDGI